MVCIMAGMESSSEFDVLSNSSCGRLLAVGCKLLVGDCGELLSGKSSEVVEFQIFNPPTARTPGSYQTNDSFLCCKNV